MELNYTDIPGVTNENFSTYTEVDVEGRVVVTDSRITFTHLDRDDTAYVYKDFGENYFAGDFSMNVTHRETAALLSAWAGGWALWNEVDDTAGCSGGTGIQVFMYRPSNLGWYLRQWTDGVATSDSSAWIDYSIKYLTIERVGNRISCAFYTDEARTSLWDNLTVYQEPTAYRYLYGLQSLDSGNGDYFTGYVENLNLGSMGGQSGYEDGGYYTTEMLDGDRALALMYNVSIPEYCGATIEFSSDNSTWVDHNNNVGSDTLTAGFESLDLRDLNTTSLYMRVNMTTNNWDTPRIYQLRLVTITDVVVGDGVEYVNVTGAWVEFNYTSITTLIGIDSGGNFLNATYWKDDYNYNVTEPNETPAYDIRFNITGLPDNLICLQLINYLGYDGSLGHTFQIEVWNFTGSSWDFVVDIPDECCTWFNNSLAPTSEDYIEDGLFMGRYYHPSPGNVKHVFSLDYGKLRAFAPYVVPPVTTTIPSLFPGLAFGIALFIIAAAYYYNERR